MIGAELSKTFRAGKWQLIELAAPIDIVHINLVELVPVLEQDYMDAFVVCHSEAVAVKIEWLSLSRKPIVIELVKL